MISAAIEIGDNLACAILFVAIIAAVVITERPR